MEFMETETGNIDDAFDSENENITEIENDTINEIATEDILDAIDAANESLKEDWIGSIMFQFKPIMLTSSMIESDYTILSYALQSTEYVVDDICKYINDSVHTRLYLNGSEYHYKPATAYIQPTPFQSKAYFKLKSELEAAALESWSPIVANGGLGKYRCFNCLHCYRDRLKLNEARASKDAAGMKYRSESLINSDKGNRRVDGKKLRRKTSSTRFDKKKCPFGLQLRWDYHGFYIHLEFNSGCKTHSRHPKYNPKGISVPARLLSKEEKDSLQHLAESCCGTGVGRNYIFSKLGKHMSKASIVHFFNKDGDIPDDGCVYSDLDKMIHHFKNNKDIAFQVLWDIPVENLGTTRADGQILTPVAQESSTSNSSFRICSLTKINDNEAYDTDLSDSPNVEALKDIAHQARVEENVSDSSNLFLAVAWVSKDELRTFRLFPEVICVDATSHSTNEKYVLLTFSVRTSVGKQVIILRCWIPNQRRFSFRWVFQEAITSLLRPLHHFKQTRLILADGDPQQANEIVGAIKYYARNARRGGCTWHIVHQGWKRHCPGPSSVPSSPALLRTRFSKMKKIICDWLYSWMREGYCESPEEYEVSKAMLFVFLHSKVVLKICDNNRRSVERIKHYIQNNVLPYDRLFLFHRRMHIRYFNMAVQSAHEGTNFGMKKHAASLKASYKISTSARTLMFQSSLKMIQMLVCAIKEAKKKKNWSSLPMADHVTTLAEGVLNQIWQRRQCYSAVLVEEQTFQVFYDESSGLESQEDLELSNSTNPNGNLNPTENMYTPMTDHDANSEETEVVDVDDIDNMFQLGEDLSTKRLAPLFRRVREVKISRRGVAHCSCCHFERTGIPCVHILSVFCQLRPNYFGFTHRDISVTWWISYICNAYQDNSSYCKLFDSIAKRDIPGPRLCGAINYEGVAISPRIIQGSAWDRIKNYNPSKVEALRAASGDFADLIDNNLLTQSSFNGATLFTFIPDSMLEEENDLYCDDDVYDEEIQDTSGVPLSQLDAREALKAVWDEVLNVHDKVRDKDLISKLENFLTLHISECRAKIATNDNESAREGTVGLLREHHNRSIHRVYASYNCR